MQQVAGFIHQPRQDRRSATPLTDASTFTITPRDVGSQAVRAGIAIQLEQERTLLLTAAKLVLARVRAGDVPLGAVYEHALEMAIKTAEAGR